MKNLVRNIFRGRKQQYNIPDVSSLRELYFDFMKEYNSLMGESEHQILKEEVEVLLAKVSGAKI